MGQLYEEFERADEDEEKAPTAFLAFLRESFRASSAACKRRCWSFRKAVSKWHRVNEDHKNAHNST